MFNITQLHCTPRPPRPAKCDLLLQSYSPVPRLETFWSTLWPACRKFPNVWRLKGQALSWAGKETIVLTWLLLICWCSRCGHVRSHSAFLIPGHSLGPVWFSIWCREAIPRTSSRYFISQFSQMIHLFFNLQTLWPHLQLWFSCWKAQKQTRGTLQRLRDSTRWFYREGSGAQGLGAGLEDHVAGSEQGFCLFSAVTWDVYLSAFCPSASSSNN